VIELQSFDERSLGMPQNSISVDSSVVGWLMAACGTLVMFLLGLGAKDLKDRLKKSEQLCLEIERVRGELLKQIAKLNGEIQRLEQRIEDFIGD